MTFRHPLVYLLVSLMLIPAGWSFRDAAAQSEDIMPGDVSFTITNRPELDGDIQAGYWITEPEPVTFNQTDLYDDTFRLWLTEHPDRDSDHRLRFSRIPRDIAPGTHQIITETFESSQIQVYLLVDTATLSFERPLDGVLYIDSVGETIAGSFDLTLRRDDFFDDEQTFEGKITGSFSEVELPLDGCLIKGYEQDSASAAFTITDDPRLENGSIDGTWMTEVTYEKGHPALNIYVISGSDFSRGTYIAFRNLPYALEPGAYAIIDDLFDENRIDARVTQRRDDGFDDTSMEGSITIEQIGDAVFSGSFEVTVRPLFSSDGEPGTITGTFADMLFPANNCLMHS